MDFDLDAAISFMITHARVLDRRRLELRLGHGKAEGVLLALDAYRNPDGGYGWALEPDHRSSTSQPVAAMQALEVLADVRDTTSSRPVELCDWLAHHSLDDGGMPFGLPFPDVEGSAPHWIGADPAVSTLQMTAQLAAQAHRLALHRTDLAQHPWLAAATRYCLGEIDTRADTLDPYEQMFALRFLDAAAHSTPQAGALLDRLAAHVVTDGPTPVPGGADGEVLHPLDFTPYADAPSRVTFAAGAVQTDLERLAGRQQADGGWTVEFTTFSPAAAVEWRGYATLQSVAILNGAGL